MPANEMDTAVQREKRDKAKSEIIGSLLGPVAVLLFALLLAVNFLLAAVLSLFFFVVGVGLFATVGAFYSLMGAIEPRHWAHRAWCGILFGVNVLIAGICVSFVYGRIQTIRDGSNSDEAAKSAAARSIDP